MSCGRSVALGIALCALWLGDDGVAWAQQPSLEELQRKIEQAKREKASSERAARERAAREKAAREQAAREKATREKAQGSRAGQNQTSGERAAAASRQAVVLVRSDAPCRLSVDGRPLADLVADEAQALQVQPGETLVECQSVEEDDVKYETVHTFEAGRKAVVQMPLAQEVDKRRQDRNAARERLAGERAQEAPWADVAAQAESRGAREVRLVGEGDGTLLDFQSGLVWTRADNRADVDWRGAQSYCAGKGSGWRLPTPDELRSLHGSGGGSTNPCGLWQDAALRCDVSSAFSLSGYRAWTDESDGPSKAWYIDLDNGSRYSVAIDLAEGYRAMCVRRP